MSPWGHGMLGYKRMAASYPNELPRLLGQAGYRTLAIGKNHFHPQRNTHGYGQVILDESGRVESPDFVSDYRQWFNQEAPGLDPDATGIGWNDYRSAPYALPERLHPTVWTADRAVEFLERYADREPFMLKVSFARPHSPYDPPKRFFDLYENANLPQASVGEWAERHAMRGQDLPFMTPRGDLGKDQVRRSRQGYYGSITFLDEQIARILAALERRGWLENTLILFTADHGDMMGDHHLWRKCQPYEGSARIPMIVRWGASMLDAPRGRVLEHPVELRDVAPTFLDAAGALDDPARFEGRSLLDAVRGTDEGWRGHIDLEHARIYYKECHWHALANARRKYIFHVETAEEQLFDLENDPGETRDMARDPKHGEEVRLWRKRLIDHLAPRGERFVRNGELVSGRNPVFFGPNFPEKQ
ncbi:MAG: Arylsulfatase [candidate division BRC1 bacterium ADurb.BinA364]|nr:MAG: Arylsulfatase [candidate division BRC1 bacterium ADurb.BinA364]